MNTKRIKTFAALLLVLVLVSLNFTELAAQCPMCRMSAESNLANGGTAGKGLNNGILYMLITPYLLIGGIAYVWWRNRRKNIDANTDAPIQQDEFLD